VLIGCLSIRMSSAAPPRPARLSRRLEEPPDARPTGGSDARSLREGIIVHSRSLPSFSAGPPQAFDETVCVHELVAAAAARWPDRPALVTSTGTARTHGELDRDAGRTAALLRSLGVGRGSFVGVLSGHNPDAVRGFLSVLRAGGAYVPLDPRWPVTRMAQALRRVECRTLLAHTGKLATAHRLTDLVPSLTAVVQLDGDGIPLEPALDATSVRELWNFVAEGNDPVRAAGFNLRPVDGEEFTAADVVGYRDHVVALAAAHAPSRPRVLEIGCGSGLLLPELAGRSAGYVGIDPAPAAVRRCRLAATSLPVPVKIHEGLAHEVDRLVTGPFDLVVLASVVQFFPGPAYLHDVLRCCARLLAPGGQILLADLIPVDSALPGEHFRPSRRSLRALAGRGFGPVREIARTGGLHPQLAERYDVFISADDGATTAGPEDARVVPAGASVDTAPAGRTPVGPDDDAYCIFTSGSTGEPKGVVVRHRSVVNLIDWINREYAVTCEDRLLMVTSFSFDLSVYDMFGVLAAGASLHLVPDEGLIEPAVLAGVLECEPITFWDSAPAVIELALSAGPAASAHPTLRRVFLSGDWVPVRLPDSIRERFPGAEVIVLGGATETTVWSNAYRVGPVDPAWPSIPYGRPMQNSSHYILDAELWPCPVGVEGDLYVAGVCLAREYVGDPELTRSRFLPDPFAGPGERMYRTGDRARWLEDGNMQFLGRHDDQVKVRGFRIELGDVQAAIVRHPEVAAASVVVVEVRGDRHLAGFYTGRTAGEEPQHLREHLKQRLPDYMIPTLLLQVPRLPVTPNGKTDRAALSRAALEHLRPAEDQEAPMAAEAVDSGAAAFTRAWESLLGANTARAGADFFNLGGDSLTAARFVALLERIDGGRLTVRDVFEERTFDRLAATAASNSGVPQRERAAW
jgi:amino acid adenylation domain-containing protein